MRDPDLIVRAQRAASALEGAWHRWRVVHSLSADPMPAVSSYVGYSLEEPWGQPRVVFGLAAQDAEQLAGLLERHDCVGPIYAAVTSATMPGRQELPARTGVWTAALPVPRQAGSLSGDLPLPDGSLARGSLVGQQQSGQQQSGQQQSGLPADYDEPVYRQAAAAMREAAAVREAAVGLEAAGRADTGPEPEGDDYQAAPADLLLSAGSLAKAASAARAEAAARIRATRTEPTDQLADAPDPAGTPDHVGTPAPASAATTPTTRDAGAGQDASAEASAAQDAGAGQDENADQSASTGRGAGQDENADQSASTGHDAGQDENADQSASVGVGFGLDASTDPDAEDGALSLDADEAADEAGDGGHSALPQIDATDALEPLPRPEVASGAYAPGLDDSDDDFIEDDHDGSANGSPVGLIKRGRATRGYPIPRLSRTKRPGAPSQPTGT